MILENNIMSKLDKRGKTKTEGRGYGDRYPVGWKWRGLEDTEV